MGNLLTREEPEMAIVDNIRQKQEATRELIPDEQIERMRVLWKKGRNMFASFFTEAEVARQQINNDELFASWCFFQLHIDIQTISNVAVVLKQDDAARVRNEFSEAKKAEKERLEAEVHAKKMEKIERQNALDAKRAENAVVKAAKAEQIKREKKAKDAAVRKQRRADKGDAIIRACEEILRDETATREEIMDRADVPRNVYDKARAKLIAERRLEQKKGTADDVSLYDQYVVEGKAAVKHQWVLGDLAIKVSELNTYGEGKLERYARDIGVEYKTLQNYQAVAKAWEISLRRDILFSIAMVLVTHPDRVAVVARDPHMTVEEAREIMRAYKAETNVVNLRG